jgi:hypothetical protein
MDRVILRKLSRKSTLNFGKYADYTVEQVLTQNPIDGMSYLTWVYYNSSNISFIEDILVQLGIIEENRINKTGKVLDKKTFYEYVRICKKNKEKHNISDIKNYLGNLQMIKKRKKLKLIGVNIFNTNKDILRVKNQKPKY